VDHGSPLQAPLDALDTLIKKHRFNADAVQKVVVKVGTHEASVVDARELPDISLQHLLAVMLVDGTVTFKSTHDFARMRDPAVLRQRAKVALVGDDELEKLLPRRVAVVEVTLTDGRVGVRARGHGARHDREPDDARGDHREGAGPHGPVLGAAKFEQLTTKVFGLESVKSLAELRPLLQRA
jgi:2-methylcitrate dehydratase PrpD